MPIQSDVTIMVEVLEASSFFLTVDPISLSVRKPAPIVFKITCHPLNMFANDVRLEVLGAVLGPAAVFSANPIGAGGEAIVTIPTADFGFSAEPFPVVVRGTEVVP